MSDNGIVVGQLRAFVERIERVEEEIKTLNDDKSEIYKEIRAVGFDVKTVRKVVAKRKLDDTVRDEQDALFDMYWDALTGGSHVHVHEDRNSYADAKLVATVANAVQTEAGRKALIAAVDLMIDREEHIDPDTGEITETAVGGDDVNSTRGARSNDGHQVETAGETAQNSPETAQDANDDTALVASSDVQGGAGSGMARTEASAVTVGETATNPQSPSNRDVSTDDKASSEVGPQAEASLAETGSETLADHEGHIEGEAVSADLPTNSSITPDPHTLGAADGQRSIHSSSPAGAKSDGSHAVVGRGRESGCNHTGYEEGQAVTNFEPPAFLVKDQAAKSIRDYRPHCQKPDACSAAGLKHCYSCSKLIAVESEVA
jgi:uncharacterized protein (UPF0335 family)